MRTSLKKTGAHSVRISVEASPDELAEDVAAAYRRVAQQVRIPGFRAGKAPRQVIDVQVGREAVLDEFVGAVVPRLFREAVREHDLAPIGDPSISLTEAEFDRPLRFEAETEVRPRLEFRSKDYRGLSVQRPSTDPTDDDVERSLDRLRERFAELDTIDRPAVSGDYVVIDLVGSIDGTEVPDASRPDQLHEVGSGSYGPDLDRELMGTRPGSIVTFSATIADGEYAGREIAFRVLVKDVKGKRLPAADDDFARTASEFDTLAELREALREQLRAAFERASDAAVRDGALEALIDRTKVDLPESLVTEETEHRVAHARERAERAGLTLDQMLSMQGWNEARFREDARDHAVRAIRSDLVLEAVARAESIEVTAEELGSAVADLAASMGRDAKEVARMLDRSGQVVTLAGDIIRSKALDAIVEHATVKSVPRKPPEESP